MKMKIIAAAFCLLCLCMALVLSVGFIVNGPSEAGANERLASAPALFSGDGELNRDYLQQFCEYFNDRFYLRQELISVHNRLAAALFGVSAQEDVILGSEGWLYYGSTLGDYTGTEPMSDSDLADAAGNLALMQEYCESLGADFLFVVCPNKNALYGQFMPSYGVKAGESDAEKLFKKLESAGVGYLDLFAAFGQEEDILYFDHDSHWNSRGAALGADLINSALGTESAYFADDFAQSEAHGGDLYEMLYPAFADSECNPVYGGELSFEFEGGKAQKADSITISTLSDGEGSLLCFRDSFGNLLYPYLADAWGSARFSRAVNYDLSLVSGLSATAVVVEIVQRNIDYLVTYCPVMPAPERETLAAESAGSISGVKREEKSSAPEGTVYLSGFIPGERDEGSPVYILCGGTAYEAFRLSGGGFGAYIPADAAAEAVAFYRGGAPVKLEIQ